MKSVCPKCGEVLINGCHQSRWGLLETIPSVDDSDGKEEAVQ